MNERPSVLIINTGGTIGMMIDTESGALKPVDFENLFDLVPTLRLFNYQIDHHCFDPLIDSSDMNPEFWSDLAFVIEEKYESYDGFVVMHGSDTMAYTASALSFMLQNLNKPVIFTGSQLPLGMIRTDGRVNLITAVEIAAAKEEDTPLVPEVCICFENQLFRGNRTQKFNAQNFEAFRSFNYPTLANAGIVLEYNLPAIQKPSFKKLKVYRNFDTNIAVLKLFPGINQHTVGSILNSPGLKGLVLETFGSGNAPDSDWFLSHISKAVAGGMIIYNVTQCQVGKVEMGKYETSVRLKDSGVISGFDITTEAAVAKLMYLLGNYQSIETVKKLLVTSLVGEMST